MTRALIALLITGGLTTTAQAADVYMWGVGPRVGTNFLPGAYPSIFPDKVSQDGIGGCDPTVDTDTCDPAIDKVREDILFGFEAHYYVDGGSRLGLIGGFDLGQRFFDAHVIAKYDVVLQSAAVDFLFGGGAGFGTQTWKGDKEKGSDAELRVPYFPLRLEVAGMVRTKMMAFQLTPYFQYNLQSKHFYKDSTGADVDLGGGFYPTAGLEFAVLFGDYEPPKPRKRR